MAIRIDTLAIMKRLEEGGYSRAQSEVMANVLNEAQNMAVQDLATKQELQRVAEETRRDIAQAAAEQKAALAEAANRQILWTVATMIAVVGAAIAITRFL